MLAVCRQHCYRSDSLDRPIGLPVAVRAANGQFWPLFWGLCDENVSNRFRPSNRVLAWKQRGSARFSNQRWLWRFTAFPNQPINIYPNWSAPITGSVKMWVGHGIGCAEPIFVVFARKVETFKQIAHFFGSFLGRNPRKKWGQTWTSETTNEAFVAQIVVTIAAGYRVEQFIIHGISGFIDPIFGLFGNVRHAKITR